MKTPAEVSNWWVWDESTARTENVYNFIWKTKFNKKIEQWFNNFRIVAPQSDGRRLGMKAKNGEQVLASRYI